jgi:two-component system, chemotaxis family, chemotaxis protein CheY
MDGLEVLARLRQIDPNAIVVIASADIQSATRDEAFKLGATDFINKPFDAIEVLAAVLRGTGRTLIPCSTVAAC